MGLFGNGSSGRLAEVGLDNRVKRSTNDKGSEFSPSPFFLPALRAGSDISQSYAEETSLSL